MEARSVGQPPGDRQGRASWGFGEGDEIAPGRSIVGHLGGGSAYEVFLVWDDHLFSLMVAKVLRPDRAEEESELRSLDNEIEALASLDHPVLVRGFDADMEGPHPHLLIEHLEGPTLRSVVRRHGSLEIEQLVPLAMHVAGALQYMANEGWVHLDVKPDNIVLGVPPRLIDLSVARTVERAARLTRPVGTDPYMAPEQCDPRAMPGAIGPATDVFGLAATLFHAVAGRVPFPRPKDARDSDDPAVRFPQLHQTPVDLPPGTPAPLSDAIYAGLARDPAERPTAAEIVGALEPVLATLPRKLVLSRRGARGV
ncbi:MAG TPA: serine/threonine-protein kinase [Solirubrobacteraceae bacterium]|jgi:serine/threonine protein kinase|nr:serine/threonine-protein kinase [Solirubrobacteraceae bacterium]